MDATYFLKERTKFIRFYYDVSEKPFRDMQDQIKAGAPPSGGNDRLWCHASLRFDFSLT